MGSNWNNLISSFKIGKGVKAILCDDPNCGGYGNYNKATEVAGPAVVNWVEGWNDRISHIRLIPHVGGEVTLFESRYFRGHSQVFGNGDYHYNEFIKRIRNDSLTGAIIPKDTTVTFYMHHFGTNPQYTVTGPKSAEYIGTLGIPDNHISSIRVRSNVKNPKGIQMDIDLTKANA